MALGHQAILADYAATYLCDKTDGSMNTSVWDRPCGSHRKWVHDGEIVHGVWHVVLVLIVLFKVENHKEVLVHVLSCMITSWFRMVPMVWVGGGKWKAYLKRKQFEYGGLFHSVSVVAVEWSEGIHNQHEMVAVIRDVYFHGFGVQFIWNL